jgi:hypothetical protein
MKITKRQLRRIIKESILFESNFGSRAPHPLLADNYAGNGWVLNTWEPARSWLEANAEKSERLKLVLDLLNGTYQIKYIPFKLADEALAEAVELGIGSGLEDELRYQMTGEDNEYNPPGW